MSQTTTLPHPLAQPTVRESVDALALMARIWYAVTLVGQLAFLLYILGFYGKSILLGQFAEWNKVLVAGYVEGDRVGNISVGVHTILAAVIMLCGLLQLLPALRAKVAELQRFL